MAVGGGFGVDRAQQIQHLDNAFRAQVEVFAYQRNQFGFVQFAGAEGVDGNRSRLGHADGVGNLNLALTCQTGGNDVFGDIAAGISGGAVYLGGIFAGEGAAAVRGGTAVSIDDDFTAG